MAMINIKHMGGSIWKAEGSKQDQWYDIDLDAFTCTCTNFAIARNKLKSVGDYQGAEDYRCKHLRAVLEKTGIVVTGATLSDEERSKIKAKSVSILAKFMEREPSPQELALRALKAKQ